MKQKRKSTKLLSMLLTVAMIVGMMCTGAFATGTSYSLTPYDSNVTSLSVSGVDVKEGATPVTEPLASGSTNTRVTYNISLNSGTASDASATIDFTVPSGNVVSPVPPQGTPGQFIPIITANATNTYTVALTDGTASKTVYVHKNFPATYQNCDIYVFNFSIAYPVSISTGDPVYIEWNGNNGTVTGRNGSTTIPGSFTLWAEGISSITVDGQTQSPAYSDTTDGVTNYAYEITTKSTAMTIVAGSYTITCPAKTGTPAGSAPTSVVSYLPIGQYATGTAWGSSSGKFAGKTALDSTGVSLGSLGGYIEFYFANGITDNPANPYGVDFVIYGNAFNGNPEPGAVQVSEDGDEWYELAGSKYYDGGFAATGVTQASGKFANAYTGTLRNADITYTLSSASITATLTGDGGSIATNSFTTAKAWWPDKTEGNGAYADSVIAAAHQDENVTISRSGDTTGSALTFGGVTAIQDSNTTADYAFGYADVTPNGSPSSYGDAVNPYTAYTSSKTGGDGFDLEWAVDIDTGLPVDVSNKTFKYVRVYSAVLDNGTFGETSCEVCGIFTAYRTEEENASTTGVGRTAAPTVKYGTSSSAMGTDVNTTSNVTFSRTVAAGTYYINASGSAENLYINGVKVASGDAYEFTVVSGKTTYIRVIAQDGTAQPFIKLIALTGR